MTAKEVEMEGEIAIVDTVNSGKVHPYILNNKKAKGKLVKNAKKDPLTEPTTKGDTTKIELSTGAYKEVVFPLLSHWAQLLKEQPGKEVKLLEQENPVALVSIRDDMDVTSKKMDALLHFKFKQDIIKLFFYHTNQSIMVQGPTHQAFFHSFLLPILTKSVNDATHEIKEFNCLIIRSLSPSLNKRLDDSVWRSATPDRHHDLKLTRSKTSKCDVCSKEFGTKTRLKIHIDTNHNGGLALVAKPRTGVAATRTVSSHQVVQRQLTMAEYQSVLSPEVPALLSAQLATPSQLSLPPPSTIIVPASPTLPTSPRPPRPSARCP